MKKYHKIILTLFLISGIFISIPESSKAGNNISEEKAGSLRESTVTTGTKNIYKNVSMAFINDSTVTLTKKETVLEVPLKDIHTIKINGRGFGPGAMIGGVMGILIGFIAGSVKLGYRKSFKFGKGLAAAVVVGFGMALMGGVIGKLSAGDELFDVGNMDPGAKREKIVNLIEEFPK